MTALIPAASQPAGVEAYEDMFKEITRKLYGDESAHGLYPHNTQVAQVAQLAPGAPAAAPEGGERSFTTLVSDRNITTIDYETTTVNDQGGGGGGQQGQQQQASFKSEEHLTTAFGLAALMQNGFPPPGAILNPVNFPAKANISTANSDNRWQESQQQTTQEQSGGGDQTWSSGGKHSGSSSYPHKSFKKPKIEPQEGSPTGSGSNLNIPQSDKKGNFNAAAAAIGAATGKRYACTSCPYTTDRRDLFTRHENIHKEEKPFHCYACLKQFNRADHVKKHFMRMHRDMEYEIAKTRRVMAVSSAASSNSNTSTAKIYYQNSTSSSSNTPVSVPAPPPPTTIVSPPVTVIPVVSTLNIPTANFPAQLSIPSHHAATTTIESHGPTVTAVVNSHNIVTLNGGVLHHGLHQSHQQQQAQQLQAAAPVQQQPQPQPQQIIVNSPIITIKQEKGVQQPRDTASNSSALVDEKPFVKKIKGEKRFTCCYCPWTGADNWGLKRHLNTHTKPYVCMLCDYKAARSERLATHVFKVHNKKACNKCTFFAEDQDQLNAHLQEAHLLNMQALGRNKASVTQDFHNAGGGNNSNSPNGGDAHGHMLTSLLAAASCSPSSSASSSSSVRSTPSPTGASRSPSSSPLAAAVGVRAGDAATANLSEEHLSLLQLLATAAVAQQHLQLQQKATSTILNSPPASHPPPPPPSVTTGQQNQNHQNSTNQNQIDASQQKRRRKSSSRNDKENLGQKHRTVAVGGKIIDLTVSNTTSSVGAAANGQVVGDSNGIERNNNSSNNNNSSVNNKNINETIFDKVMYKKPSYQNMFITAAFCKPVLGAVEKDPRKEDRVIVAEKSFSLAEFLRNHTEVSISTLNPPPPMAAKSNGTDDDVIFIKEEKRRKQQAPRKVDQEPVPQPATIPNVGDIRDKHMIRLVTRRLCCRICQNQQRSADNCHYHSKTSLILHQRWRHGHDQTASKRCQLCGESFLRKYKLTLHQKLAHRSLRAGRSCTDKRGPHHKAIGKKSDRKLRKRKARSRCFTKRRK